MPFLEAVGHHGAVKKIMFARLQVSKPGADKAGAPLVSDISTAQHSSPFRINGRLSVLESSIVRREFDYVQLCLRGVIATCVGTRSALENIITLTDMKVAADFKPSYRTHKDDTQNGRHLDFYFEMPTSITKPDGTFHPLPLSGTSKGTINLTQTPSLNDHRVIYGECEVSYWIEAKFRRAGTQLGLLHRHIQIQSLYPRLRVTLAPTTPLTIRAKPDILTRCRFQKIPDICVTLPESEMPIRCSIELEKRHIAIPLAVTMNSSDAVQIQTRQSLTCDVEVKWQVSTRFSTLGGHKSPERRGSMETIHKVSTASIQKSTILFRPLPEYDEREVESPRSSAGRPFLATSQLDLSVPDTVSQPTLDWKHLSRNYTLQLCLHFRGTQGAPHCKMQATLPLSVNVYGSKADDADFNQITADYLDAALDFGEADDLAEIFSPLRIEANAPQALPQRATRTPPPPYFR